MLKVHIIKECQQLHDWQLVLIMYLIIPTNINIKPSYINPILIRQPFTDSKIEPIKKEHLQSKINIKKIHSDISLSELIPLISFIHI